MERIEQTTEVDRPVRTVYNQWTQFEEFPRFMRGVKEVTQLDDTHVRGCAEISGKIKQWDVEITEQVPDQKIGWKSISGDAPNAGTVRFEPLGANRTQIRLVLAYEPQGAAENAGDALGLLHRCVEKCDAVQAVHREPRRRGRRLARRGARRASRRRARALSPGSSRTGRLR